MEHSGKFELTYNAIGDRERREIESIRNRYIGVPETNDKRARLARLDFLVRKLPIYISVVICVIGLLVFGTGLAFVLEFRMIGGGAALGAVGLVITVVAYPVYKAIYWLQRRRYAGQIVALTDELLNYKGGDTRA